jgi:hypothetical protein
MSLRHSGQRRVGSDRSGSVRNRLISALRGRTTPKNTAVATIRNEMIALMTRP